MWTCHMCGHSNPDGARVCAECPFICSPYPVIRVDEPCHSCEEEIQPGQSYVPTVYGPEHVYRCGGRRRRASL